MTTSSPIGAMVSTDDERVVRYRFTVTATNAFGGKIGQEFFCVVDSSGPKTTYDVYTGN